MSHAVAFPLAGAVCRHRALLVRPRPFWRRPCFGAVLLLHAAVVAALLQGRGPQPDEPAAQVVPVQVLATVAASAPEPAPAKAQARESAKIPRSDVMAPLVPAPSEPMAIHHAPQPPVAATSVARQADAASAPIVTAVRFDADYLRNPTPAYPPASRRFNEEGSVLLRVLVSAGGSPLRVEVRQGSGYRRLDEAAREAVARWRFVPARLGAEPVEAWVEVPVEFSLAS